MNLQCRQRFSPLLFALLTTTLVTAQTERPDFGGPPPGSRAGGFGGEPEERKLVKQFDRDGDKRLNAAERKAARQFLAAERAEGRAPRRPGPRGRLPEATPPPPGRRLTPADVKSFPNGSLYDPTVLRTLFFEFESPDWEAELADFYGTDVEVPAKLIVDGRTYEGVGVHFRGASSFFTVPAGRKRSLNVALDFTNKDQRLYGYRTLNLLNSHTDPTYLRAVLYFHVAGRYVPTPKANYVRVVINGESWGIYLNVEQFNKDFLDSRFGSSEGARWKVPGSPRGRGGLEYLGDDVAAYKRIYEIKSKDKPESWAALIQLCRVLHQTPPDNLEAALEPILDLDGTLKFLALENVFINNDGYWIRASDYSLYLDSDGRFHLFPYDGNETFRTPGGPGFGRGQGVDGVTLDPLAGSDDPSKPLLHKLLAVPTLKQRYLAHVREIAQTWLDWDKLGPLARQYQALIADDVKADTHKLASFEAFQRGVEEDTEEEGFRGPRRSISLKSFVEQRRAFLSSLPLPKDSPVESPGRAEAR
jgi:hypothetical protein